jgi:hypothetical protein
MIFSNFLHVSNQFIGFLAYKGSLLPVTIKIRSI